jgi:hypothetical protein
MSEMGATVIITVAGVCGIVLLTLGCLTDCARLTSALDAWRQRRRSVKPLVTQPLMCRMIGHRWTALKPYRLGDMRAVETQVFGCCTRCGEPTPEELTWHEYDPDLPQKDPLDLARGWDLREGRPGTPQAKRDQECNNT